MKRQLKQCRRCGESFHTWCFSPLGRRGKRKIQAKNICKACEKEERALKLLETARNEWQEQIRARERQYQTERVRQRVDTEWESGVRAAAGDLA